MKKKVAKAVKVVKKVAKTVKVKKTVKATRALVALILDESGSMSDGKAETISCVNEYIESLKKQDGSSFTLVKFNTIRVVTEQNGVPIKEATKLTLDNYKPDASTPLYDAVGKTITDIEKANKVPTNSSDKVLVVVVTDGQENSSREFTREQVVEMIRQRQDGGWTFVYLGTGHDAFATATSIGIKMENTAGYLRQNTKGALRGLTAATMSYCASKEPTGAFFSAKDRQSIAGEEIN